MGGSEIVYVFLVVSKLGLQSLDFGIAEIVWSTEGKHGVLSGHLVRFLRGVLSLLEGAHGTYFSPNLVVSGLTLLRIHPYFLMHIF